MRCNIHRYKLLNLDPQQSFICLEFDSPPALKAHTALSLGHGGRHLLAVYKVAMATIPGYTFYPLIRFAAISVTIFNSYV